MQKDIWENEYRKQKLVSMSDEPQASVKDFVRWLRKGDAKAVPPRLPLPLENLRVLDLGCGNGKNSAYIAGLDATNRVVGLDISETALKYADSVQMRIFASDKTLDKNKERQITYLRQNIGEKFPDTRDFADASFDIVFDVTSSNSLDEKERETFLSETHRVLKPGGYFFVRTLCKDADKNAQHLLKNNPGPEKDTYIMPGLGLTERVFSRDDFIATYSGTVTNKITDGGGSTPARFSLLHLEKETHYSTVADRLYKRNFWVAYFQKPWEKES